MYPYVVYCPVEAWKVIKKNQNSTVLRITRCAVLGWTKRSIVVMLQTTLCIWNREMIFQNWSCFLPWKDVCLETFCRRPSTSFWVILLMHRQTHRQTRSHHLLGGAVTVSFVCVCITLLQTSVCWEIGLRTVRTINAGTRARCSPQRWTNSLP